MKKLILLLLLALPTISFGQWVGQLSFKYAYKGTYNDSVLRIPVINSNRAFYSDKDSVGRLFFRPDSVKLFGHFPGNVIKTLVTYDTILSLKNNTIKNQLLTDQTADFAISGVGSAAKLTTFNSSVAGFNRYLVLGHSGTDTTQQSWSIGLTGIGGGGPGFAGNTLTFRSHTTTGGFINDVMTLTRGGLLTLTGQEKIGTGTVTGVTGVSPTLTVVNSVIIGQGLAIGQSFFQKGAIYNSGAVTITTDYTIQPLDLFINVNNTANCTITIPAAAAQGNGLDGRIFYIKKTINNAFTVTIVVSGGTQTIDGSASAVISAFNASVMLHDDGTNWFVY